MGSPVRAAFLDQARSCHRLGSPFTGRLLDLLATRLDLNTAVGHRVLHWPGEPVADALALRLAGSLHALVLAGRSPELMGVYPPTVEVDDDELWRSIENALDIHGEIVLRFLDNPPQTNEVARSAALAAGFLTIANRTSLPLTIFEIGASAGLNLHLDSFGFDLGGMPIRKEHGKPLLSPAWQGPPPPIADLRIVERTGCDRNPIDVHSSEDVLRLRAYIWPDQIDRRNRLDQALKVARLSPLVVDRADAADWTAAKLKTLQKGVVTVLFHTIVWQYLTEDSQTRLAKAIKDAGGRASANAPFAWMRMEPETRNAAALRLTLWPDGQTLHLAEIDYHGRWLHWRLAGEVAT